MSSALSVAPLLLQETGVSPTRTRRQFSTTYTLQILAAADACTKAGELGALLRREGLYSSHLAVWRAARRRGDLQGPAKRRGPPRSTPDRSRMQIAELEHALARATARGAWGRAGDLLSGAATRRAAHVRRPPPRATTRLGRR